MMDLVQLPRNYLTGARCHPAKCEIVLNRDLMSTAKVTIPESEAADFPIRSLIELYTQNGSVGIFRVISTIKTYGNSVRLECAHAVDLLSDSIINLEDSEFSGTVANLLSTALGYQTTKVNGQNAWQLGTCADTNTYNTTLNYTNVYDLIDEIEKNELEYYFTFDFSTTPWTINFIQRPTVVGCEFRLSRNIAECTITRNDAELCTRLFLSVTLKTDETITNPETQQTETVTDEETTVRTYNADTQSTWGIVQRTDACTVRSIAEADAYATRYFTEHKNPQINVVIDGAELNRITGSTWDEMDLGAVCRVALPDYGETVEEQVVSVEYPDALNQPTRVKVTLANKVTTGSQNAWSNSKTAAHNSSLISSMGSTQRMSLIDTLKTDYMLYEAGIAKDAQNVFMFAKAQGILGSSISFVDLTASGGRTMFSDEFEIGQDGKLTVKRGSGMQYMKNNVAVGIFDNDNLTAGVMIKRINGDGAGDSEVIIKATKVDLGDYATVTNLNATNAEINNLKTGVSNFTLCVANTVTCSGQGTFGTLNVGNAMWSSKSMTGLGGGTVASFLGTGDANLSHYHTVSFSSGKFTIGGPTQTAPGPFDVADTQWYKDNIAAAKSGIGMQSLSVSRISGPSGAQIIVYYTLTNGKSNSQQFTI